MSLATRARYAHAGAHAPSSRDNLDQAVAALPDAECDNAMVTPALLALLLRAFEARRQLDGLELALAQTRVS